MQGMKEFTFAGMIAEKEERKKYFDSQTKESLEIKKKELEELQQRQQDVDSKIEELKKDIESKNVEKVAIQKDAFGDITKRTSKIIQIDTAIDLSEKSISQMQKMGIDIIDEIKAAETDIRQIESHFVYKAKKEKIKPFVDKYKQAQIDFNDSREQLNNKLKEVGLNWEQALVE